MIKKNKSMLLIFVLVLVVCLAILVFYLNKLNNYKEKVANTQITNINFREISDGVYIGYYDVDFIYAKVEVTVKEGKIIDIVLLEHKNDKGKEAERIIEDIKAAQSLNVDAVSGATNSSVVIKKAIENALINASN
ncbi:MAG TPA: FMN-binding protein [Defluviitaleaceae bacterium]|jgi:uncharacterized protein with FMN-binding domain|nr:FMN-binding protein [Candidatus Epulonipiscium sp.]HOA80357.1 FMN-binding protein [Defluviitaleaceae bacterium]